MPKVISKFEKLGDIAETYVPSVTRKILAYNRANMAEVHGVIRDQGAQFFLDSLPDRVTKWTQELFELKGEMSVSMFDDGANLTEELLDDMAGKSMLYLKFQYGKASSINVKPQPSGSEPRLAFGSPIIGKLQARGDMESFLKQTSSMENMTLIKLVSKAVSSNIESGQAGNYPKLLGELQDILGNENRAKLMAHTLTIWSYNQGSRNTFKNAGISEIEWQATEDELTCPYCNHLNGTITHVDLPFLGPGHHNLTSSAKMLSVPWAIYHAPLHPFCRCTQNPILPDDWGEVYQAQKATKPKKKYFDFSKIKKPKVMTYIDLVNHEGGFVEGVLILGDDGKVYEVTNDPHDLKVKIFGGGEFDYAYCREVVQTSKVKKLQAEAEKTFKLKTTKKPEPKVEVTTETTEIAEDIPDRQGARQVNNRPSPLTSEEVSTAQAADTDPEFPDVEDLKNNRFKVLNRRIGGSMGAMLIEDEHGRKFILKVSKNWQHLQEEAYADQLYNQLGGNAPASQFYKIGDQGFKLAAYIEDAVDLDDLRKGNPEMYEIVRQKIQAQIALNAFLGNNDAIGMEMDNILVTFNKDGVPIIWNVDNGGSMRFRAQGKAKQTDSWDEHVQQLWTFRRGKNISTPIFGDMDYRDVVESMADLALFEDKLNAWIANSKDEELNKMLRARFESVKEYLDIGTRMLYDKFDSKYTDNITHAYMELNESRIPDRYPKFLNQHGNSKDTTLIDEDGKKWDDMKGRDGTTAEWEKFAKSKGVDPNVVWKWAKSQGGSSFNSSAVQVKRWWASKRNVPLTEYFWGASYMNASEDKINRDFAYDQSEEFDRVMTMWHAFNLSMTRKIDFPYKNNDNKTVGVIRTESNQAIKGAKKKDGKIYYKQQVYASSSLTNLVSPQGHQAVVSTEVPYHRILGYYWSSRGSQNDTMFLGSRENEVIYMQEGMGMDYSDVSYNQYANRKARDRSAAASRIDKKIKEYLNSDERKEKQRRKVDTPPPEFKPIDYETYTITLEDTGSEISKDKVMELIEGEDDEYIQSFVDNSVPLLGSDEDIHVLMVWCGLAKPKTGTSTSPSPKEKTLPKAKEIPDGQLMDVLTSMVDENKLMDDSTTFSELFVEPLSKLIHDYDDVDAIFEDEADIDADVIKAAVKLAKKNKQWNPNGVTAPTTGKPVTTPKKPQFKTPTASIPVVNGLKPSEVGKLLNKHSTTTKKIQEAAKLLKTEQDFNGLLDMVKKGFVDSTVADLAIKLARKKMVREHEIKVKEGKVSAPVVKAFKKKAPVFIKAAKNRVKSWQKKKKVYDTNHLDSGSYKMVNGWEEPKPGVKQAYGMVMFDDQGRVLLRKPANKNNPGTGWGGALWTFAKGGVDKGMGPASTAIKEVGEETGYKGSIQGIVEGGFYGTTSKTNYFVGMAEGHDPSLLDEETEEVQWLSLEDALDAIAKSPDPKVVQRDTAVLVAAYKTMYDGDKGMIDHIEKSGQKNIEKAQAASKKQAVVKKTKREIKMSDTLNNPGPKLKPKPVKIPKLTPKEEKDLVKKIGNIKKNKLEDYLQDHINMHNKMFEDGEIPEEFTVPTSAYAENKKVHIFFEGLDLSFTKKEWMEKMIYSTKDHIEELMGSVDIADMEIMAGWFKKHMDLKAREDEDPF